MLKTEIDTDNFDGELWFQQVSANEHTACVPIHCLRPMFPGCVMSCFGDTALPVSSPDLSTTHYLLQDTWKSKFMQSGILDEVEGHISVEVRVIEKCQLRRIMVIFNH